MKWRYESAGIPNRTYPVQDGNRWSEYRPPLVLDTIGMPLPMLVDLLAHPPQVPNEQRYHDQWWPISSDAALRISPDTTQYVPLIALAHPSDWRTLRLLKLCPTVQLVFPDDPTRLRRWLPHLDTIVLTRSGTLLKGWLIEPAPDLKLDPLLLPALAALRVSPSLRIAAERCEVSESTMARMLRGTKAILGLPPGDVSRFRPDVLAAIILNRMGTDAPVPVTELCV